MKKLLLCLCAALLCTACSPVTEPPAPSGPSQGSSIGRYPEDGSGAETQFGPKEDAMPVLTEGSAVASLAAGGDLGQAIDSIGGNGFVLIEGQHRLTADVTVPADTVLLFARGAMLCPEEGVTLTVSGFVQGADEQLFGGAGRVVGTIRNAGVPHWFGSLDGEDDSAVMQKAVDALQLLQLPQGTNYTFRDIVISKPIRISGVGNNQTKVLWHGQANTCLFDIRSSDVCIEDLWVEGDSKGTAFYFNTAQADIRRVTLYNIKVFHAEHCVSDAKSGGAHTVCDVNFVDLHVQSAHAEGYYLTDFRTGIRFDGVQTQNLHVPYSVTKPGMLIEGVQEMYAADIDITGGRPQDTKANGLVLRGCSNVTLDRSMMEYTNGHALWLDNCRNIKVEHYVLCGFNDAALRISDCDGVTFDLLLVVGTYFPDGDAETFPLYHPDEAHGMYLTDSRNIIFNALALQRCAGKGIILENVDGCHFNAFTSWYVRDTLLVQDADCSDIVFNAQVKDE